MARGQVHGPALDGVCLHDAGFGRRAKKPYTFPTKRRRSGMDSETTRILSSLAAAIAVSAIAILMLRDRASAWGLLDNPGGRKAHSHAVPLVGGLGIFMALMAAAWLAGVAHKAAYFL